MFNKLKTVLFTATAVLVLAPAMSSAAIVNAGGTLGSDQLAALAPITLPRFASSSDRIPEFLTTFASQSSDSSPVPHVSLNADPELPEFVSSDAARRNPLSVNRRGSVDLSLWNLVAAVHAQQRGDFFEGVEASVASIPLSQPNVDPLSAVPLPPAVWLFVMGVLGLAGTRITGLAGGASRVSNPAPARDRPADFGAAVPA